jgi:hypothetical protein
MRQGWFRGMVWLIGMLAIAGLPRGGSAQQPTRSDVEFARQGPLALAAAHGEKPRYGGKFLSVGNEKIPTYDMHQTSLGGVASPHRPTPSDPPVLTIHLPDIIPELNTPGKSVRRQNHHLSPA